MHMISSCYAPSILVLISFFGFSTALAQPDSLNMNLIGRWSETGLGYNDVWGYTDSTGREYAIIGTTEGTGIVEITDSTDVHLVTFIDGPTSPWRDIKTWKEYAYVTTDDSGAGIQIIDLSDLPDSGKIVDTYKATVGNAHNLYINEGGFAYICGATGIPSNSQGGLNILNLTNPTAPVEVGRYTQAYIHDVYVRNDTAYGAGLQTGIHIIDVTDKANPSLINRVEYPNPVTHNLWTTEDGSFLCTTDEFLGGHLQIFDVRDPFGVNEVGEFIVDSVAIIHNVLVRGNLAFLSYYTEGTRIVDISDPMIPVEVGFYDTFPESVPPGTIAGNWGVYPFFPSGKIVASDMQTGLYVFRFSGATVTVNDPIQSAVPVTFHLEQNYPNPFNPSTVIRYDLPRSSDVSLTVFNLLGEEVANLVNEIQQPGVYSVAFKAGGLASGIYFYRLSVVPLPRVLDQRSSRGRIDNFIRTHKMVLLR